MGTPNSINQSIYNHMCTGLPKEGCVTLDESPNITK